MTIASITLGFLALVIAIVAMHDLTQRKHAVTRNFPVIGHLGYFLRKWGNRCVNTCSLGDLDEQPITASRVHGCTPPQKARTICSGSDRRLITTNSDGP